ncbi:MAG: hypothetical protein RMZ69_07415 [Nostoc sp. ChiQUE01a]|nr:hypothetical protein [Nostoc sp. ChiQUE01a]
MSLKSNFGDRYFPSNILNLQLKLTCVNFKAIANSCIVTLNYSKLC